MTTINASPETKITVVTDISNVNIFHMGSINKHITLYNDSPLLQIPLDILELIVYENPWKTIPALTQTCKLLYRRLRSSYMKHLTANRPFFREIHKYLQAAPRSFSIWHVDDENIRACEYNLAFFHTGDYDSEASYTCGDSCHVVPLVKSGRQDGIYHVLLYQNYSYNSYMNNTNEDQLLSNIIAHGLSHYDISEYRGDNIWEINHIDLLSQYRIYSKRLGCVARNPSYALTQILTSFEQYCDEYTSSMELCNNLADRASLTCLIHCYLRMQTVALHMKSNMSMMDIEQYDFDLTRGIIRPPDYFSDDDDGIDALESQVELMEKEIEEFIPKIRRRLELLPLTDL